MNFRHNPHGIKQRLIALLAIVSILLGIIAPSVSHAVMAKQVPLGMVKVCGANGTTYIPINFVQTKRVSQNLSAQLLDSNANAKSKSTCKACDQHASSYADLIGINQRFLPNDSIKQSAPLFYRSPVTIPLATQHNPRGPPQIIL